MTDSNESGYGKPPKHSRFQKGQSGNVKGRPKGHGSIKSHRMLEKILSKEVSIIEDGKKIKITMVEALERRVITEAINGNYRAMNLVFQVMTKMPYLNKANQEEKTIHPMKAILAKIAASGPPPLPYVRPSPEEEQLIEKPHQSVEPVEKPKPTKAPAFPVPQLLKKES